MNQVYSAALTGLLTKYCKKQGLRFAPPLSIICPALTGFIENLVEVLAAEDEDGNSEYSAHHRHHKYFCQIKEI